MDFSLATVKTVILFHWYIEINCIRVTLEELTIHSLHNKIEHEL